MPTSYANKEVTFTRTDDGIPQITYRPTNRGVVFDRTPDGVAFITGGGPANLLPTNDHLSHLHTRIDKVEESTRKLNETLRTWLFSSSTNITEALRSMKAIPHGIEKLGNWATASMPVKGAWWAGLAVGLTADKVWDLLYSTIANFVASQASAAMPTAAATVVVSNFSTAYPTITATTTAATITVTNCFVQVVRPTR